MEPQPGCGSPRRDAAHLLRQQHADKTELIDAFYGRFDEMMAGPISGTVDILAELHARGTPLYLLSNFSAETYPLARQRFDFLRLFHGIIVSGEVKAIKPEPRIYEILIDRHRIDPHRAVFIDDIPENIDAARRFGFTASNSSTRRRCARNSSTEAIVAGGESAPHGQIGTAPPMVVRCISRRCGRS